MLNLWIQILVVSFSEFLLKLVDSVHMDNCPRSRSTITVMFGKVKDAFAARDLHVDWEILFEAMLPVD